MIYTLSIPTSWMLCRFPVTSETFLPDKSAIRSPPRGFAKGENLPVERDRADHNVMLVTHRHPTQLEVLVACER